MLNTFEKTKAHEARRAAIQRQMEAMEAAASSRNVQMQQASASATTTARRRTNQVSSDTTAPAGSLETARRFLWDEDEDNVAGADQMTQSVAKGGRSGFADDTKSVQSTSTKVGHGSVFTSLSGIFGGKYASGGQNRAPPSKMTTVNLNDASSGNIDDEYRPSFFTSCYVFFRHLVLACALSIGSFYMWFCSRAERLFGSGRGKRLCLLITVIMAVVIPVAIFAPKGSESKASILSTERLETISRLLIEGGVSSEEDLYTSGTPQRRALEWISSVDPAKIAPDDRYLPQRYALAVLYYSTHGDDMYQTASVNITRVITPDQEGDLVDAEEEGLPAEGESEVVGDDLAAQPEWISENGWMSGSGICSWYGVECHHRTGTTVYDTHYDGNNGVIVLNMTDNNVRGKFPTEVFAALNDLRWVSLSGNGFFGSIPTQVGKLINLQYMSLANNFFTGTLPNTVADLSALNRLYIDGNYFQGTLPAKIGSLTNLVSLSIYNNYFSGIVPATMSNLKNLTSLYLDINHLSGSLPSNLGTLSHLVDLRLRHNRFKGTIPTEYAQLKLLEILYLDRNQLTGTMPTDLGKLTRLNELHIYRNTLKGSIPTELGLLRDLSSLYLDNNHLTGGIPTEFGNLNDLEQIYLHKNRMDGTIPTEIGKMENLRNFRVYTNGLRGTLPTEIGNAFNLKDLYAHDNLLEGTLPESVSELTKLERIRLYWNKMTGSVPEQVCDLKSNYGLVEFKTDCAGDAKEVTCDCCTECFK